MPQTKVRTPDGNTVTVNHPEGATDEQIIAYAQQNYSPEPAAQPQTPQATGVSESGGMNFLAGVGKAFSDLGRGVQQRGLDLVSMLPESGFIRQSDPQAIQQRQGELRREEQLTRERDAPRRCSGP